MAVLSILLLLALTDASAGLFWRNYIHYKNSLSWTEAQTFCRNSHVDLAVFNTQWEFTSFCMIYAFREGWIGLRKNPGENEYTQWSDGHVLNFFRWGWGEPSNISTEDCVLNRYGRWYDAQCTTTNDFFCYFWAPEMIVVQEMKNWDEALAHCRTHYTDLVSLTTETDHFLVNNRTREILSPAFWTGLRFMDGSWFWVNQKFLLTPSSLPLCPAKPYRCGARNIIDGVWENRDCEEKMNFICYHNIYVLEFTPR
ncbi:macrophage mannose receptor 1-like [Neoarius graeffei]|uniref:macrophage mannose receptor 1-like n=1 Tax=Neoarius graeffei TaxID=443677 RepID=UPI00298C4362|nr:macrophage mannose receptor 1-like [Neoarius graeffei]